MNKHGRGFVKRGISVKKANRKERIESHAGTEMEFCPTCRRFYSQKMATARRATGCPHCGGYTK